MPSGIYLHIPFCRIKCPYCDFNTFAGIIDQMPRYLAALETELERRLIEAAPSPYDVASVYFGGGTPSLIPPESVADLLQVVRRHGAPRGGLEVTLEANPGTVDRARLQAFRDAGVTRLTIGAQTFRPHLLAGLSRLHDVDQTRAALADARAVGFDELNLDLMFAQSRQSQDEWEADLDDAFAEEPTHLSLYNLTVEEGTPLGRLRAAGRLPLPDEEACRAMYVAALGAARDAGMLRYEVSNFARPGSECVHNRIYWRGDPWLGIGAGAHGFAPERGDWGRRWWNLRVPRQYCEAVEAGRPPEDGDELLDRHQAISEALLLGLRTSDGLDRAGFERRFGFDPVPAFGRVGADAVERGLLQVDDRSVVPTEDGVIILDFVIERLARQLDRSPHFDTLNSCKQDDSVQRVGGASPPARSR